MLCCPGFSWRRKAVHSSLPVMPTESEAAIEKKKDGTTRVPKWCFWKRKNNKIHPAPTTEGHVRAETMISAPSETPASLKVLTEAKPEQISETSEETSTTPKVKVKKKKQKQAKAKPALKVSGTRFVKVKDAPLRISSVTGESNIIWNYLELNTERKDMTSNMETAETNQVSVNPTSKVLGPKFIEVKEAPVKMKTTKKTALDDLGSKTVARKDIVSHCDGLPPVVI